MPTTGCNVHGKKNFPEGKTIMTILDRPVPRKTISRPVMAPVMQVAPMQSAPNSWEGEAVRFTSSPWEGLYWEADPPTEGSRDEDGTLDGTLGHFLMNLMYGE